MIETCVPLGRVLSQYQELLIKWVGRGQYILAIIDCFKEPRAARRYASGKLHVPALICGRQKLPASDELDIEANFGIVFGHEPCVQCAVVVLAGFGDAGGNWKGTGSTVSNYASQTGHFGSGAGASNNASEEYSRRGQNSDDQPSQGQNQPLSGSPTTGLPFACPFYRYSPVEHQNCLHLTLSRIGDVRQHIKRRHTQPRFCPRCGSIFQDDTRRDAHFQSCRANLNPPAPAGMTPEQLMAMNDAARRREPSPEARWYEIWNILFPGQGSPLSPYIDVAVEWRRIGTHTNINVVFDQYRRNGRLSQFSREYLDGIDLEATLDLLLRDILHFNDHSVPSPSGPYPGGPYTSDGDGTDVDNDNNDDEHR